VPLSFGSANAPYSAVALGKPCPHEAPVIKAAMRQILIARDRIPAHRGGSSKMRILK
jgi:hypothetical protein